MIQINFPSQNIEEQRKKALSKVYALLIRLAEEAENRATPSVIDPDEKKVAKATSVPLQNNIPPAV